VEAYYAGIAAVHPEITDIISDRKALLGEDVFWDTARRLALQTVDMLWMEHLEAMDHLRGTVNLRAYGQRDPLVEYKKEGLRMFHELESGIMAEIAGLLPNIGAGAFAREEQKLHEVHVEESLAEDVVVSGASDDVAVSPSSVSVHESVRGEDKVGRNDPCPCGSGKKYKKCCGK
jgi:preprotein translocase subunit SecA